MIKEEVILGKIDDINAFLDEIDMSYFPLTAADRASDFKGYLFKDDYLEWYKAIYNGNFVALVCLRHDDYKCENSTHLSLIEVKSNFRGKYIGTEVMDEVKHLITSKGRSLTLSPMDIYDTNRPLTENFYMKVLGFEEVVSGDMRYLKYTA